jgi:hypothetical protein
LFTGDFIYQLVGWIFVHGLPRIEDHGLHG